MNNLPETYSLVKISQFYSGYQHLAACIKYFMQPLCVDNSGLFLTYKATDLEHATICPALMHSKPRSHDSKR